MRVLFDQNVPLGVRKLLEQSGHDVVASPEIGWERLKNGDLLLTAQTEGFDVMVTCDKNLQYQQNLKGRELALVVLGTNNWGMVKLHTRKVLDAVNAAKPGSFQAVDLS